MAMAQIFHRTSSKFSALFRAKLYSAYLLLSLDDMYLSIPTEHLIEDNLGASKYKS